MRSGNLGDLPPGARLVQSTAVEEMQAHDALPPAVRKFLANCPIKFSSVEALEVWQDAQRRGVPLPYMLDFFQYSTARLLALDAMNLRSPKR